MTQRPRCALGVAVSLWLALATTPCRQAAAQSQAATRAPIVARLAGGVDVELVNLSRGATRTVYRGRSAHSEAVSVSPTGRYVALIEVTPGTISGHNYATPPMGTLVIVDTMGAVVQRVTGGVARYAWCGTDCVAYITGPFDESDRGFRVTGAGVANLATRAVRTLPGPPWPYALAYASFDSSLYAVVYPTQGQQQILRYDALRNVMVATSHRGIDFSDDGEYYLEYLESPTVGRMTRRVFQARTDSEVVLPSLGGLGTPVRWLPSGPNHLVLRTPPRRPQTTPQGARPQRPRAAPARRAASPEVDYIVYDVAARRQVRMLRASFPNWGSQDGIIPIITGGRADVVSRP